MKVLYLHTTAPPKLQGTDALHNTVEAMAHQFAGAVVSIYPFQTPISWYPRPFYGFHNRQQLVALARSCDIVHVFSPTPVWYPILKCFHDKKIILSVVAGVPSNLSAKGLNKYHQILVSNRRDEGKLISLGQNCVKLVRPGIDTSHIDLHRSNPSTTLHLLMASAPWTKAQFYSKGIDLLLSLVEADDSIEITFLWRNLLHREMLQRVAALPSETQDRIEVINKKVDINKLLQTVDAVALLVIDTDLVKAHPHSLVEGLAAGKPLLLSSAIPMADYVHERKCGVVLTQYDIEGLQRSIAELKVNYQQLEAQSVQTRAHDFNPTQYYHSMDQVYSSLLST